jgi:hypothetical protein
VPEEVEQPEYVSLAEAVRSIGDAVEKLRFGAGLNLDAIIVLLQDHTKLPKKTIKKVLDGLNHLHDRYCEAAK